MSTALLTFTLCLKIKSPFLFAGLGTNSYGVDTIAIRNELGQPIIPADQIRGVLKEGLADFKDLPQPIEDLFGKGSDNNNKIGSTNEPVRGVLFTNDLIANLDIKNTFNTTRIEIEETGATKKGSLQVLELIAPFGSETLFVGEIQIFDDDENLKQWEECIKNVFEFTPSIGSNKTAGYGEIVSVCCHGEANSLKLPPLIASTKRRIAFSLQLDRPFLVSSIRLSDNAFKGSDIIPGSVLKGALAWKLIRLGLDPTKSNALANLSFTHAFPAYDGDGDIEISPPLPLSIAMYKDEVEYQFVDRLKSEIPSNQVTLFQTDWKDDVYSSPKLNRVIANIPLIAKTHTALFNGTAKENSLFTTLARSNLVKEKKRNWFFEIETDGSAEQEQLISVLKDGLYNVGKTSATAVINELKKVNAPSLKPIYGKGDEYALVLKTSALMLDAANIGSKTAKQVYEDYFKTYLNGTTLLNFYASQKYQGGHLSYRNRLYGANTYFPFLLTDAGSVFLIKTNDVTKLKEALSFGLPLPKINSINPTWDNCPYVRENGFGRFWCNDLTSDVGGV